jgi:hypothetical protein
MRRLGLAGVLALVVPITGLMAAPAFYSGAAVRGRVVDAESQHPLEGVHVVTQTVLSTGILHGEHVVRFHVAETVTNARGEYELPAWGPKARPVLSELDYGDPTLTYFKPGYRPEFRANPAGVPNESAVRISQWDGATIPMTRFRDRPEEWARALRRLQRNLAWGVILGDGVRRNDYWKAMPAMVWAVEEARRLLPDGVRHIPLDLENWDITESDLRSRLRRQGSIR